MHTNPKANIMGLKLIFNTFDVFYGFSQYTQIRLFQTNIVN